MFQIEKRCVRVNEAKKEEEKKEINDISRYSHFLTSKLFLSLFQSTSGARTHAHKMRVR
jgi:hypothetical protein